MSRQLAKVDAGKALAELTISTLITLSTHIKRSPKEVTEHFDLCTALAAKVVRFYSEIHREYHDVGHPVHIVSGLKTLIATDTKLPRIDLRIFNGLSVFHDVIVKVGREFGWNEEQSALLAEVYMRQAGCDEEFIRIVCIGIRCTARHELSIEARTLSEVMQNTIKLFLDFDLAGLGQAPGLFALDTEAVWQEFCAIQTRQEYDSNRTKWAKSLLIRSFIYHTEHFRKHSESQARENLERLAYAT